MDKALPAMLQENMIGAETASQEISDDTLLADLTGLDIAELLFDIKDEYGVSVPLEAVSDMKTVGEIGRYIRDHRYKTKV